MKYDELVFKFAHDGFWHTVMSDEELFGLAGLMQSATICYKSWLSIDWDYYDLVLHVMMVGQK